MSSHVMFWHVMPCHLLSCHIMSSYHLVSDILHDQFRAYKTKGSKPLYVFFLLLAAFHCLLPALLRVEVR